MPERCPICQTELLGDEYCPKCKRRVLDEILESQVAVLQSALGGWRDRCAQLKAANETLQDDLARSRHAADKAAIAGYEAEQKLKAENEQLRDLLARCVTANDDGDYYNDVHVWGPAAEAAKEKQ